nr:terminase small subunit protein [Mycoavidus cysteinexigens]
MVGQSLRSICAQKNMPYQATVYRWLTQSESFRDQYARAREVQADTLADEVLDIADDATQDMQVDEQGHERVRHEAVQRSKLRVDARKWLAGQLAPKKYGDRIQQNISGAHDGPIEQKITIVDEVQVKATVAHLEENY